MESLNYQGINQKYKTNFMILPHVAQIIEKRFEHPIIYTLLSVYLLFFERNERRTISIMIAYILKGQECILHRKEGFTLLCANPPSDHRLALKSVPTDEWGGLRCFEIHKMNDPVPISHENASSKIQS